LRSKADCRWCNKKLICKFGRILGNKLRFLKFWREFLKELNSCCFKLNIFEEPSDYLMVFLSLNTIIYWYFTIIFPLNFWINYSSGQPIIMTSTLFQEIEGSKNINIYSSRFLYWIKSILKKSYFWITLNFTLYTSVTSFIQKIHWLSFNFG